ncbi:putative antiviral protein [Microthyrium microscopicum]|uniref:Putative antiviral protein n=1 Tax=Microthyrium microscopicum TaxID=703497 RepID=A0A6A6U7Z7_9PEZI|nr:putative antiviral protein [Microthyrium microscopicum]
MSSNKVALKAVRSALEAKKYDEAARKAKEVVENDPDSFFGHTFLGRALDKIGKYDESEKAYMQATRIKPEEDVPWVGLTTVYEVQGSAKVDQFMDASVKLAQIYESEDKLDRCQTVVDKILTFARKAGNKLQQKRALELQLPTSPLYSYLEGRLPPPAHTYNRIIELAEEEEDARIKNQISERRTRIGARKEQVTTDVKREVYEKSNLLELYQGLIDWTQDDAQRREFEEKRFQRIYDHLLVVGKDKKAALRAQVQELAHGMVIIKHPYELAWNIELEWQDVDTVGKIDVLTIREYVDLFPDTGLTKVLNAYMTSPISPFPIFKPVSTIDESSDEDDFGGGGVSILQPEDRLLMMNDGLLESKSSPLTYRIVAEYFLHLEEYEGAVETVRKAVKLSEAESRKSGLKFQNNLDAMNTTLATALIKYQSPRNHPEAKVLFEAILKRKQNFTPALLGVGLVLEEEQNYPAALEYLTKASIRDPDNVKVAVEAAWVQALNGDLQGGLDKLQYNLEKIKVTDQASKELQAETLYRIGQCQWDLNPSRSSRKDRKGPYKHFLAAVKANVNLAPAYTSLGIFYEDYGRDKKRARQCFQKAFDLSPSEVVAAERLARSFADQGDWDVVEVVAQRVIDAGKARPPPGSSRKGLSWPYSAIGVVQMSRLDYQRAIVSFLAALRISPDDYHSFVGLGESYHNSGRYNSALRTFNHAENPEDGTKMKKSTEDWFTKYMLANVSRELGAYEEAIKAYREVLDTRETEFGVEIALMQTLIEYSWRSVDTGFFGRAVECASQSLDVALNIAKQKPKAFNLWKAVADACSIFSWVQDRTLRMPTEKIVELLEHDFETSQYDQFSEVDSVSQDTLDSLKCQDEEGLDRVQFAAQTAILAQKRALHCAADDIHAQAVSWYNLGWAEYRAHTCLEERSDELKSSNKSLKYAKAAMRCFKRAIELEAGNMEFWNSLGVATTKLNPKVAQHSFVRSIHLNERNPKAWSNLGTLYLLQNDFELAHLAFSRAQSADPEYSHAWLGEGIIALLIGNEKEALLHFTHAFEISESSTPVVKKLFATSAFDQAMATAKPNDLQAIQPVFALQQLRALNGLDLPFDHLLALYHERSGNYTAAITVLEEVCEKLEAAYEDTESPETLEKFIQAKSDLSRNYLAVSNYADALSEVETALSLLPDAGSVISKDSVLKLQLSGLLTQGLAQYYSQEMNGALESFKSALKLTDDSPNVACSVAEVLWAEGGEDERNVAKQQLFDVINKGSDHVGATILLGIMGAIEGDKDTTEAVVQELEPLRTRDDISARDLERVERVLESIRELSRTDDVKAEKAALRAIHKGIMSAPYAARGWSRLADLTNDEYAAGMMLLTSKRSIPPRGTMTAPELATAYSGTGIPKDGQRAIMLAPYSAVGWISLADAI